VDTAQALIGAEIEETVSVLGGQGTGVAGNDAVVSMRFADGSLATICYGNALPTGGKEWIEVSAGSHRLVIDDFRSVQMDGKTLWKGRQDKGHRACTAAFRQALTSGTSLPTRTMRATIHAASAGSCRG
jgi:hypothetical protein